MDHAQIVERALRRIIADHKPFQTVPHSSGRHRCIACLAASAGPSVTVAPTAALRLPQGTADWPGTLVGPAVQGREGVGPVTNSVRTRVSAFGPRA